MDDMKFKVGDIVKVTGSCKILDVQNVIGIITNIRSGNDDSYNSYPYQVNILDSKHKWLMKHAWATIYNKYELEGLNDKEALAWLI
ncbi:MAG: hypothetical protein IMZ52_01620 [Actinobacteria bacterium]|nr:hypothetical protein [Actinomycetota bacterium]MBE3114819.1 hypothetical protein [Actinomycetota bacterium]